MKHASVEPDAKEAWYRPGHFWHSLRNWPVNADNPYSPISSVALLLIVGLIVHIGR